MCRSGSNSCRTRCSFALHGSASHPTGRLAGVVISASVQRSSGIVTSTR